MKIAIHHNPGSFSERWIEYCKNNKIPYKLVNCYDSDIIEHLRDCDALMWHYHHANYKDALFAKQLLFSLEQSGMKVFPNFNTAWHFDDKVGQKYLLEKIGAPIPPSYLFYEKEMALEWAKNTNYPKVFKLRRGAGSANVKLVKNKEQAIKLINTAFGKGFSQFDSIYNLKERIRRFQESKDTITGIMKGIGRLFIPTGFARMYPHEKGYVYFQDFIPNNNFDIRIIAIGNKAFGIKRLVRNNDFRASGSGDILYKIDNIVEKCVKIAFEVNKKLKSQCIAFDFVLDKQENPLIVEISYGFSVNAYDLCPGYWTNDLKFHKDKFNPQAWMIEDLVSLVNKNHAN